MIGELVRAPNLDAFYRSAAVIFASAAIDGWPPAAGPPSLVARLLSSVVSLDAQVTIA